MKRQGRIFETRFEVRDEGDGPIIAGYGAVFDTPSLDLGGWREVIRPGAFKRTLKGTPDVLSFFNHNPNNVLGRTTSGTLTVSEDFRGLAYQVKPPDATWANDLLVSMRRGDVRGSSFMFDVVKAEWIKAEDGVDERHVSEVRLYELGPVTMPAYPAADAGVRSLLEEIGEGAGIDFRALAGLLERRRDGAPIPNESRDLIAEAIERLQGLLPAAGTRSDPPQAGHSLDVLRRRLELVGLD